jgi:hypothetical protein
MSRLVPVLAAAVVRPLSALSLHLFIIYLIPHLGGLTT